MPVLRGEKDYSARPTIDIFLIARRPSGIDYRSQPEFAAGFEFRGAIVRTGRKALTIA